MLSKISIDSLKEENLTNDKIIDLLTEILESDEIYKYEEEIKYLSEEFNEFYSDKPLSMILITERVKYNIQMLIKYFTILQTPYIDLHILNIKHNKNDADILSYYDRINDIFSHIPNKNEINDIREKIENVQREIIDTENELLDKHKRSSMNDQLNLNNLNNGISLYSMTRHLDELEIEYNEYAPIPSYIREFDIDVDNLPKYKERNLKNLTDNDITEILLEDVDNAGMEIGIEDKGKKLLDLVKNLGIGDKEYLVSQMTIDYTQLALLRKDKDLTRFYGPVNARLDDDYKTFDIENLEEYELGGPRMFIDTRMEYDETTDSYKDEWFTGYCDYCNRRIKYFFHAVREPYFSGGWRGCFCTWDCVYENVTAIINIKVDDDDVNDNIDLLSDDTRKNIDVTVTLINVYAKWLDEVGIADREPFEDEDENESEYDVKSDLFNFDLSSELIPSFD